MSFFTNNILYLKINEKEAQVGNSSEIDQNALNGNPCPSSITIEEFVTIDGNRLKVTKIGKRSFRSCRTLKEVSFPDSITIIEDFGFDKTNITHLKLPKSLTSIGLWAFGSNYFETIEYNDNLIDIGNCSFSPSYFFKDFNVPSNHKFLYSDSHGALLNKEQTILYTVPISLTEYKIPETITKINGGAFQNSKIESIIVPQKCKYIGYYAFSYCSASELTILGNILFFDTQYKQNFNKIIYYGSISVSPNTNILSKTDIEINVCVGYKSQKFSTIDVNQLDDCPAVIFYTSCLKCFNINFPILNNFKLLVLIFILQ